MKKRFAMGQISASVILMYSQCTKCAGSDRTVAYVFYMTGRGILIASFPEL